MQTVSGRNLSLYALRCDRCRKFGDVPEPKFTLIANGGPLPDGWTFVLTTVYEKERWQDNKRFHLCESCADSMTRLLEDHADT
jgi:hypothetical protein